MHNREPSTIERFFSPSLIIAIISALIAVGATLQRLDSLTAEHQKVSERVISLQERLTRIEALLEAYNRETKK